MSGAVSTSSQYASLACLRRQRYHVELSPFLLHRQLTSAHHRSPSPQSPVCSSAFSSSYFCFPTTASRFPHLGFGRALEFWVLSKVRLSAHGVTVLSIAAVTARPYPPTLTNVAQICPSLLHHVGPAGAACPSQRRRIRQPAAATTRLPAPVCLFASLLPPTRRPTASSPVCRHVAQLVHGQHARSRAGFAAYAAAAVDQPAQPPPLQLAGRRTVSTRLAAVAGARHCHKHGQCHGQ